MEKPRECPHCGGEVERKDIYGTMKSYPEVGLQCKQCPINFFLRYDEMSGKTGDSVYPKIVEAWNKRLEDE